MIKELTFIPIDFRSMNEQIRKNHYYDYEIPKTIGDKVEQLGKLIVDPASKSLNWQLKVDINSIKFIQNFTHKIEPFLDKSILELLMMNGYVQECEFVTYNLKNYGNEIKVEGNVNLFEFLKHNGFTEKDKNYSNSDFVDSIKVTNFGDYYECKIID